MLNDIEPFEKLCGVAQIIIKLMRMKMYPVTITYLNLLKYEIIGPEIAEPNASGINIAKSMIGICDISNSCTVVK